LDALRIDRDAHWRAKALALPPGFAVFAGFGESGFAALKRFRTVDLFWFPGVQKGSNAQWMTPSTPSIGHIHALPIQA